MSDLVKRLRTVADMIYMCEKIPFGQDVDLMLKTADEIERLRGLIDNSLTEAHQKYRMSMSNGDWRFQCGWLYCMDYFKQALKGTDDE